MNAIKNIISKRLSRNHKIMVRRPIGYRSGNSQEVWSIEIGRTVDITLSTYSALLKQKWGILHVVDMTEMELYR